MYKIEKRYFWRILDTEFKEYRSEDIHCLPYRPSILKLLNNKKGFISEQEAIDHLLSLQEYKDSCLLLGEELILTKIYKIIE